MGLYEDIISLKASVSSDGTVSGILSAAYRKRYLVDQRPSDYYYLTDIVNPAQAYWTRKRKEIKRSQKIANKLSLGNKLQNIAYFWLRKHPDYVDEETTLDGIYTGIPGVIAKYDIRFGNSIIEFKTKDERVMDPETVFTKYPQDLEQICFYAVMHPFKHNIHYLIFQETKAPFPITVFKIEITDFGKITNLLKQRKRALDEAIKTSNPDKLGKCRYFTPGCDFKDAGVCSCGAVEDISTAVLRSSINLVRDTDKEAELNTLREKNKTTDNILFRPFDLFKPRAWILDKNHGIADEYSRDPTELAYLDAMQKSIGRSDQLALTTSDIDQIKNMKFDLPMFKTWQWAAILDSRSENPRKIVPVMLRVSNKKDVPRYINSAYKAQMLCTCIATNSETGALVTLYPNAGEAISVNILKIDSENLKAGKRLIKSAIDKLKTASETNNIKDLDPCLDWARPKFCGECPESCEKIVQDKKDQQPKTDS
ncbi:MAG: hypothetical protein PHS34_08150 [Candidatus Omnitrophica bacterium]|nr:hypothetical protein [Candidatus Nanoarchaeia archaeon]MDD5551215.1 hypothetical protein [Candidatus Omnitrophota bacterium]